MIPDLDAPTRARLRCLYPDLSSRLIRVYADMLRLHGVRMRLVEGVRMFSTQARLYQQGRRDPQSGQVQPGPIVTWAPAGYSMHHWGTGVDSCFQGADPWLEKMAKADPARARELWSSYGRLGQAHGFRWGGDWDSDGDQAEERKPDRPHLEMRYGGLSEADLLKIHARGGIRAVWSRFDGLRGLPQGHEWDFPPSVVRIVDPDDMGG